MIVLLIGFVLFLALVFWSTFILWRPQSLPDNARYVVGIDMGIMEGKTSVIVIDANSGEVVNDYRPNGNSSLQGIKRFVRIIIQTYDPQFITVDIAPHHMGIVDDWGRDGINIRPARTGKQARLEMVAMLADQLSIGRITIPFGVAEDTHGKTALMIANHDEMKRSHHATIIKDIDLRF